MYNFLRLAENERKTVFLNSAQKMGMHEAVIEKDFWVCLVLDYLFHKNQYKEHLAFKGGTSLSKCFSLIKRFSEDIDLILDWRVLGYSANEPWRDRSKTKQDGRKRPFCTMKQTVLRTAQCRCGIPGTTTIYTAWQIANIEIVP
jgi:hypothetical protein